MKKIVLDGKVKLNLAKEELELFFVVPENGLSSLYLEDIKEGSNIHFELNKHSNLQLSILADKELKDVKISVNVAENAAINVYFADFSTEINNSITEINLNENGAQAMWHLASLSSKKDRKMISVSVYHNAQNTFARVDNYGVAKDESKLVFTGTSHIKNGSIKSSTQQNAKIMVFDPKSDAIAKPILKIDENDIEANHSAAVGKISDEQIFYLTSRGISEEQAKMLITLGYLKPIFKGFDEQEVNKMNDIIGGRL